MASTNPQDPGGDAKGRLPSRRRARRSLLPALTLALLAASVPVAWIVTGDTVTVQQAAVDQPEFTEEPSEFTEEPFEEQAPRETSFWSTTTEVNVPKHADRAPVELGMRFTPTENGSVAGVRFYKAEGEKGRHVGSLWNADGQRLASVRFDEESESGWQEARFAEPVELQADQVYTVSYHSKNGTYVGSRGFTSARSGPLNTASRNAGVFGYGDSRFPRQSNPKGYNYWVDVIFRWRDRDPNPWNTRPPRPRPSEPPIDTVDPNATANPDTTAIPDTPSDQTDTESQTPTASADPSVSQAPDSTPTPSPSPTPTRSTGPTFSPRPTFSPGPTLSPIPGGGSGCAGYPTPACTGVPPGTKLTELKLNMDGDSVRITQPGTVLNAVHIPGSLLITADNVTITNSQIDGQIIGVYDNKRYSFTVSDSTIGPTNRCDTAPGILDADFTATRVHIRGHGDGFSVSGDNVTIQDSYVLLCSNPGDHSDGIQTVGASKNLTFHHNTVDQRKAPSHTAPVFLVDRTQGVTVTDNLLIGGTYTVQIRTAPGAVARNNAVVADSWNYGPASIDCANTDWSGNSLVTIDNDYNVTSTVGPLPCPK
ncbi:DUF4082 domain-containing protein [Streptosporangium sp. 'caverna']|uniref:DUF4082 domain-containing protein n=1 Tax=Streptosporangium sp. 'caverna' TaxID=2202249 RepID=UPI000D7DC927|nr:DUF4082 domain-containing protein [Streptosporangium sp. 'caverna']AWS40165.1 hypothetical protein DKM19_01300 [Streptosporangium sp. 'caverna']